jgi:hypothetical protein
MDWIEDRLTLPVVSEVYSDETTSNATLQLRYDKETHQVFVEFADILQGIGIVPPLDMRLSTWEITRQIRDRECHPFITASNVERWGVGYDKGVQDRPKDHSFFEGRFVPIKELREWLLDHTSKIFVNRPDIGLTYKLKIDSFNFILLIFNAYGCFKRQLLAKKKQLEQELDRINRHLSQFNEVMQ